MYYLEIIIQLIIKIELITLYLTYYIKLLTNYIQYANTNTNNTRNNKTKNNDI